METRIRVGGVPEHFNFPIHLAYEKGMFAQENIHIEWTDFPSGTGQLMRSLRDGTQDVVVALTEGVIADIIQGNPSKIIGGYVNTPLIWGIHTSVNSSLQRAEDIFDKQHAISRFGSGSHLMPIINANSQNETISNEKFTVVQGLSGAIKSLESGETEVFYWEKYTTKPLVDAQKLRRIGEYIAPWPCFVFAARDKILTHYPDKIVKFLDIINESSGAFMTNKNAIRNTAKKYELKEEDVENWFHKTEWATNSWVSDKMIGSVIHHLKSAQIIDECQSIPELIWK